MAADSNPQKYQTIQLRYTTQNQSVWDSNTTGGYRWSSGDAMYLHWKLVESGKSYDDVPLVGKFGGGGSIDSEGHIGLRLDAFASSGSVDVDCPLKINLSYPTYNPVNGMIPVDVQMAVDRTATVHTYSPQASAKLVFHIDGDFAASANVKAFSESLLDFKIKSFDFGSGSGDSTEVALLDSSVLVDAITSAMSFEHKDPATDFTAEVHFPVINTSGNARDGVLKSSGNDYLIRCSVHLTNLLTNTLTKAGITVPPLSMELEFPGDNNSSGQGTETSQNSDPGGFGVDLGYTILDAYVSGDLGFQQDFAFTPKARVTLLATDREGNMLEAYADENKKPLTFPVQPGTRVWFQMPASGMVQIAPTVVLDADFKHELALRLVGSINLDPLAFEIGGKVCSVSLPSFDWKPTKTLRKALPVTLPPATFTPKLAGLPAAPVAGATFSVIQKDMTLPGIGSMDITSANPYNHGSYYEQETESNILITVTPDVGKFRANPSLNSPDQVTRTRFYLDHIGGQTLDLYGVNATTGTALISIQPSQLTEGVHQILCEAIAKSGDSTKPFTRLSSANFVVNYWKPAVTELHRAGGENDSEQLDSVPAGSPEQVLYLMGHGFSALSKVFLNGQPVALDKKRGVEPHRIQFVVPAAMLAAPGNYDITVVNPEPGGGASNAIKLTVSSLVPTLKSVEPVRPLYVNTDTDVEIVLRGTNFLPGCTVKWPGTGSTIVTAQYVSREMVTFTLPATALAAANLHLTRMVKRDVVPANPKLPFVVLNPMVTSRNGVLTGGSTKEIYADVAVPPPYVSMLNPTVVAPGSEIARVEIVGNNFDRDARVSIGPQQNMARMDVEHERDPATGLVTDRYYVRIDRALFATEGNVDLTVLTPYYSSTATGATATLQVKNP